MSTPLELDKRQSQGVIGVHITQFMNKYQGGYSRGDDIGLSFNDGDTENKVRKCF